MADDPPSLQDFLVRLSISRPDDARKKRRGEAKELKQESTAPSSKLLASQKYKQLSISRVQLPPAQQSNHLKKTESRKERLQQTRKGFEGVQRPGLEVNRQYQIEAEQHQSYSKPMSPPKAQQVAPTALHPKELSSRSLTFLGNAQQLRQPFVGKADIPSPMDSSPMTPSSQVQPKQGQALNNSLTPGSPMLISPEPEVIDLTTDKRPCKGCRRQSRLGLLRKQEESDCPNPSPDLEASSKARAAKQSLYQQVLQKSNNELPSKDAGSMLQTPKASWQVRRSEDVEMRMSGSTPTTGSAKRTSSQKSGKSNCISQATRAVLARLDESGGMWSDDSPLVKSLSQSTDAAMLSAECHDSAPEYPQRSQDGEFELAWCNRLGWSAPANRAADSTGQAEPAFVPASSLLRTQHFYSEPNPAASHPTWISAQNQPNARQGARLAARIHTKEDALTVFRSFGKQQEAMDYAEACNQKIAREGSVNEDIVKCWCEEKLGGNGVFYRTFLAASYDAFWSRYCCLAAHARHCYEVIQKDKPCHLYFDLEFQRTSNPGVNGDAMVDALIEHVAANVRQQWGLEIARELTVELDSSTAVKFSRHLLVRIPGHALESNAVAQNFVHCLVAQPEAAALTVKKTSSGEEASHEPACIIDTAVYTKNRHFRILWSSKGGKSAVLKHTGRFSSEQTGNPLKFHFLESLVCNVAATDQLLTMEAMKLNTRGMVHAPRQPGITRGPSAAALFASGGVSVALKRDERDKEIPQLCGPEELQACAEAAKGFIEETATERASGLPATVRTIVLCGNAGVVAFGMIGPGSHYCENMGRPHKSNHVYFVVDFLNGHFCQKCYDPDCCNYSKVLTLKLGVEPMGKRPANTL